MRFTSATIGYIDRQRIVCDCGSVQDISIGSELIDITANNDASRIWFPIFFTINNSGIIGIGNNLVQFPLTSYREEDEAHKSESDNVF